MSNSIAMPIENMRIWSGGNWVKCTVNPNLVLRTHYDQLLITYGDKVLESLNTRRLKGIFKDDVLILIVSADNLEVRKIKFQIKDNLQQCLRELKTRFPIIRYGMILNKSKFETKYYKIEDVFKTAVKEKGKLNAPMPENYLNFVKQCLLDPMFPQLVEQTKKILDTEILKKKDIS